MPYILAIDQGTTSSRAFIINERLDVISTAQQEFPQYYPHPGWVEHNPEEIWDTVTSTIRQVLQSSRIPPSQIVGIGITNQRETTVLWERSSGKPVQNAIVWQCRRTAEQCEKLKAEGHESFVHHKTGLVLDPYFSATKINWILEHNKGIRARANVGDIVAGTIDSFLVWRLTGGHAHVTDVSNASRTLLMDIQKFTWDDQLCELFDVPKSILPEIVDSSAIVGVSKGVSGLPDGIPIAGIAGDQQAALFGQGCFNPGQAKCTYGTGSFILMNTGDEAVFSKDGLLTTVAWRIGNEKVYALEGASFIAGAAVQWLRDGLGIIKDAAEIESLARSVESSHGVMFVPALSGLGAPHWRADARGVISGITRGTTAAHIARATLEGIAFQQCDLLNTMSRNSGMKISELRVDGGASANNLLMQIQSDLLGVDCVRPKKIETTVMGAAFLAGLAVGVWTSEDEIANTWQEDHRFVSRYSHESREHHIEAWRKALARA